MSAKKKIEHVPMTESMIISVTHLIEHRVSEIRDHGYSELIIDEERELRALLTVLSGAAEKDWGWPFSGKLSAPAQGLINDVYGFSEGSDNGRNSKS